MIVQFLINIPRGLFLRDIDIGLLPLMFPIAISKYESSVAFRTMCWVANSGARYFSVHDGPNHGSEQKQVPETQEP